MNFIFITMYQKNIEIILTAKSGRKLPEIKSIGKKIKI